DAVADAPIDLDLAAVDRLETQFAVQRDRSLAQAPLGPDIDKAGEGHSEPIDDDTDVAFAESLGLPELTRQHEVVVDVGIDVCPVLPFDRRPGLRIGAVLLPEARTVEVERKLRFEVELPAGQQAHELLAL